MQRLIINKFEWLNRCFSIGKTRLIKGIFLIPVILILNVLFCCCTDRSGKSGISEEQQITEAAGDTEVAGTVAPQEKETVTDIDGNEYTTIRIGRQTWMVENLKTTRYNDGTEIPQVTDGNKWASLTTPAYCWYENEESFKHSYGALYNGYAVNTGKLCPDDWRVPGQSEVDELTKYLGGENFAGETLKASGTTHWVAPNFGATNQTGFTALPGGLRYHDGKFHDFGFGGYWWTSTGKTPDRAVFFYMDYEYGNVFIFNNAKRIGFSVRCLRDY